MKTIITDDGELKLMFLRFAYQIEEDPTVLQSADRLDKLIKDFYRGENLRRDLENRNIKNNT